MPLTMTQADYARRCNVTRAAVNQGKQDRRIVMTGPLVAVDASVAELAQSLGRRAVAQSQSASRAARAAPAR
jgi:hypothetical protein